MERWVWGTGGGGRGECSDNDHKPLASPYAPVAMMTPRQWRNGGDGDPLAACEVRWWPPLTLSRLLSLPPSGETGRGCVGGGGWKGSLKEVNHHWYGDFYMAWTSPGAFMLCLLQCNLLQGMQICILNIYKTHFLIYRKIKMIYDKHWKSCWAFWKC